MLVDLNLPSLDPTMDPTVLPWEVFFNLLPNQRLMNIRPQCGLLEDGRAFATKSCACDTYFLFPNKLSYIRHFLKYYLYVTAMNTSGGKVKTEIMKIVRFTRMQAVKATEKEIQAAAETIPRVKVTQNPPTINYPENDK